MTSSTLPAVGVPGEHPVHDVIVAVADCGCLWGASVLGYGHDADAYKSAAEWARKGAIVRTVPDAEFHRDGLPPLHCPVHPDGRWDDRGRDRKPKEASLGL